ncbi:glutathione S-transferase family protein [Lysobacter maris]|uniref:Glutathione S-transferase family protein n=1 Tax=Marilutibacter maris TaxID=1605891 RepID=A0A508AEF1_9GAMM|nr:glutathione S-transferase family protein [Lysobacter maris]KAB8177835.1 glutathione S-transferase family protein [Lysobacter maris]
MNLQLFAHPFSSYSQKVLIALYENDTPFQYRMLSPEHPDNLAEFARRWPIARFPLLVDGDRQVEETSLIIEHLQRHHPGPVALLPADPGAALPVRRLDRLFDLYVSTPMQKIVLDHLRPESERDGHGVEQARQRLDTAYAWLDTELGERRWACGASFTLADCAAAPALFYADWVQPIDASLERLRGYRARLLAHPSVARAVDEARPYRELFPPGAPDRD